LGTNGQNPSNYGGSGRPTWQGGYNSSWYNDADYSSHNLVWRDYSGVSFAGNRWRGVGGSPVGTPSGWNDWVNRFGGTGLNSNPQFVNNVRGRNGYIISSTSPVRNAGENLRAFIESKGLPWTDIEGHPRDNTPDIGAFEYSGLLGVENGVQTLDYKLEQNYPNPFNPSTTISFSLPKETYLRLNIYNILGELVQTLADGTYEAGYHTLNFNAANLASGMYIYRIESDAFIQVRKMILLR
jgi:hypothetical protein